MLSSLLRTKKTTQITLEPIDDHTDIKPLANYCAITTYTLKGQMHHHDDLGSKCAYSCHLSNKTTRKSVLLSTPEIWLMKVSKKTGLSLGMEADISRAGHIFSTTSDWLRDISGRK